MTRNITLPLAPGPLGESGTGTITITGCPCQVKEVMDLIESLVREFASSEVEEVAKRNARLPKVKKPCGCKKKALASDQS